jgi:VIT1/CCC1 family predicted Fe2+/Mn2+ transporter
VNDAMSGSRYRVQVLFLAALLGVLVVLGIALGAVAGPWTLAGYAVVVLVLLVVGAGRAKAAQERSRRAAGRTCSCCTTSQHDPVKVI